MAGTNEYLDYTGLEHYHSKIQTELDKKVNTEVGKKLTTEDFTTELKNKLDGLTQYVLPVTTESTLGGVMIATSSEPVPSKPALKADATGKAYVDWKDAPQASTTEAGLIKLGNGFKSGADGAIEVDGENIAAGSVDWDDIQNKPDDLLKKGDLGTVYRYKGSVSTYSELANKESDAEAGDVYNVEDTGMNYAFITAGNWDALGATFTITPISTSDIDALFQD